MSNWKTYHTLLMIALIALIGVAGLLMPAGIAPWLLIMLLMALVTWVAGHGTTGVSLGMFIDDRNMVSLSRFQLVLWTVVILSSFLAASLANIANGVADPLAIAIPMELWFLMGISTTSLVGSPMMKHSKRTTEPDDNEFNQSKQIMATKKKVAKVDMDKKTITVGVIIRNNDPSDARLSDMFDGEETGNGANLDLAKLQMFFFTLVVVFAYAVVLREAFMAAQLSAAITELPALSEGIIALLGISHAGYLAHKAVPLSQTKKPDDLKGPEGPPVAVPVPTAGPTGPVANPPSPQPGPAAPPPPIDTSPSSPSAAAPGTSEPGSGPAGPPSG